jgi:hypothetical protein
MLALSDADLDHDWAWRYHSEGVRFALLGTYHELRDLAVEITAGRAGAGRPITIAQHTLAQYHAAYWDLLAVMLGVEDAILDTPPAEGEWPPRRILEHVIGADALFFTLVHFARVQHRRGDSPRNIKREDFEALITTEEEFDQHMAEEGLAGILSFYDGLHQRIMSELASLSDEELNAPSLYWEGEPLSIRYRLHRFDAHLRQHTIQMVKTLAAVGPEWTEAKQLLRTVYNALAEVEGALLDNWDFMLERQQEIVAEIEARAMEIASVMSKAA